MSPENKRWENLKAEYLHKVEKALSAVKHPRKKEVVADVSSHLDNRFAELGADKQTWEDFQAIITDMGPASDYAELLEPEQKRRTKSVPLGYLLFAGAAVLVVACGIIIAPMVISYVKKPVAPEKFRRDFPQKVANFDIDNAGLDDVIRTFGQPVSYIWGSQILDKDNLPISYVVTYPDNFHVLVSRGKVIEIRHEYGSSYVWRGKIKVGASLEEVFEVLGEPEKTVVGEKNRFEDGVLYKDIEGRKGHCYYGRYDQNLRLWFGNYKVAAIYMTRNGYGTGM